MISSRQVQTRIIHFLSGSQTLPAELSDNIPRQSQGFPKLEEDRLSQSVSTEGGAKMLHSCGAIRDG